MRLTKIFILLFISVVAINKSVHSQNVRDYQVITYEGEKYFLHKVRMGETFYSITKRFQSDRPTVMNLNPETVNGLKVGQVIRIPYKEGLNIPEFVQIRSEKPVSFKKYTIRSNKETPYSIAKKHNISVEELYTYNGRVRSYRKGVKLNIPQWKDSIANKSQNIKSDRPKDVNLDDDKFIKHKVKPKETLYSLSKQYNIPISEILLHNRSAKDLKAGATIYIPVKKYIVKSSDSNIIELKKYIYHRIKKGETMWSITHRYDVEESQLIKLNPFLKDGFPLNKIIRIPIKGEENKEGGDDDIAEVKHITHVVKPKETLYSLSKQYNVSQADLLKANPVLRTRKPIINETLIIPINKKISDELLDRKNNKFNYNYGEELEIPNRCKENNNSFNRLKTFNVSLFLPLYADLNESMANNKFYKNSESFLQFYEGVLIAVDRMKSNGLNVNLHVFDTKKSLNAVRQELNSREILQSDLIIGPVFPSIQKEIAQVAYKNRIPFISPLATVSSELKTNDNFYQITPTEEYITRKTAQFVLEEYSDSHMLILNTKSANGNNFLSAINTIIDNSRNINEDYEADILQRTFTGSTMNLKSLLSLEKHNLIYVPSSNEGEVSLLVSNLNNLSDKYDITLVGSYKMGSFKNMEIEQFHNLNLHYIAPYYIDYKDEVTIDFIKDFRTNFHTEPNAFAFQGYDIAYFFLNALQSYGSNFNDCIRYLTVPITQGEYQFEKYCRLGGYMNGGVTVVEYKKKFDVEKKRIIKHYR